MPHKLQINERDEITKKIHQYRLRKSQYYRMHYSKKNKNGICGAVKLNWCGKFLKIAN